MKRYTAIPTHRQPTNPVPPPNWRSPDPSGGRVFFQGRIAPSTLELVNECISRGYFLGKSDMLEACLLAVIHKLQAEGKLPRT